MNSIEYNLLSEDLKILASNIPLKWGYVQNNRTDDNINMFELHSYQELEYAIRHLAEPQKNYLRRRWYLWQCSNCDEYLFYKNDNVIKNPNQYDKKWDICINNEYFFDVKGTVIPRIFRDDVDSVLNDPTEMINFFYDEQSKGRRYDIQNRLFIVHHSFVSSERELYLRSEWKTKEVFFKFFCSIINRVKMFHTHGVEATVIFILEKELGVYSCLIP